MSKKTKLILVFLLLTFFLLGIIAWWEELVELWNVTVGEAIKDLIKSLDVLTKLHCLGR